jgi:predicted DNA-binding transcriptional regulator
MPTPVSLPIPDDGEPQAAEPKRKPPKNAKRTPTAAAGRFATLNAFVDFTAGTLERSELLVWLILFRDQRNGIARTGQADIARRTQLGERTVRMAIASLRKRGLLELARRGGVRQGPSSYRLRPVETPPKG